MERDVRYLVVLGALRRHWERSMKEAQVDPQIVQSWGFYFHQLTMQAATCEASELEEVGRKIAKSFATCVWYIERARSNG